MTQSKHVSLCKTESCRIQMLQEMFDAIKGTSLLLEQIQPDPDNQNYDSAEIREEYAFKTLIATILSVRTRDETTLQVMEKLWGAYSTPQEIAEASIEHLEELIHSSGTYRQKAKRIKETSRIIHEQFKDKVPKDQKKLLTLPGVGRKVANCVLVVSFNIPVIPVDTHVHRIANRTGWVTTKNPEKTEIELEKLFPQSEWVKINYTMVSFGKTICKPINPSCDKCPINNRCAKIIIRKPKMKKTVRKK